MSQQPQRKLSPLALPQTKKKPQGNPIDWSDEDLDALAAISPADLKTANALWEREAPAPVKTLLQAQVMEKHDQ